MLYGLRFLGPNDGVWRKRRERKPNVAALIKRAEKNGKKVTSVTVDGVTLMFDQPSPARRTSWDDLETGTRQ